MLPVRWLVALVALTTIAFAQPSQLDPAGRLAYIDPQGRLATVHPDGSGVELLSVEARLFQFPAWSPDGERIAAIANDAGGGSVQLFSFDGSDPVELYRSRQQAPFYLYWSPDGGTVSFLANHPTAAIGLHLATIDPLGERTLMTGSPFYWQWAADSGSLLAHIGLAGPGARLGFSDVGADTLERNLDAPGFFQAPAISPSGRWLAYAADRGGARTVIVRSAPGLTVEPIEREVRHIGLTAMAFSPTADLLALMRPPEDAPFIFGAISLLDAETGLLEPLVDESALAFFWSPDGGRIAYLTFAPRGGEIASDPGASVQVRAEQQRPPRFSLKVVEVASGEIVDLGAFVPSRLFVQQFLPFFDQYALSHRIWSPDSNALVLPILDDQGRSQVTVLTLDGQRRTVVPGDGPFWNVR